MPRQPRKTSKSMVYHCMLRGINKQDIFFDKQDYLKFQKEIKRTKERFSYQLYSYILMPNHVHLEIKDVNQKLSQIMHSMEVSYASYFNKKYKRVGHLFENRFRSKNVEGPQYILNLVRYIHQNPVVAGISAIEQYSWSSYSEYIKEPNEDETKLVDTAEILSMFSLNPNKSKEDFIDFHSKILKFKNSNELLEYEMRYRLTDEELIHFIKETLEIENIQEIQSYSAKYRDDIIFQIKKISGATQKQIARVLGINIRVVQRACINEKNTIQHI